MIGVVERSENFLGLELTSYNVSKEVLRQNGKNNGIWQHGGQIDLQKEIIVGFSPTNYHTFIISRNTEFHGHLSFNNCRVLDARTEAIRAAVFLRIRGIEEADLIKFEQYLSTLQGKRAPSCHIGCRQALEEGLGIRLAGDLPYKLEPYELMYYALKNGLVDKGQNKLEVSLFTSRDQTLSKMFEDINHFVAKFRFLLILSEIYYHFIVKIFFPHKVIKKKYLDKDKKGFLRLSSP